MTISQDEFKQGLQLWASGVTVITTNSEGFGIQGMTATSFSSVSLDPPQILVCINESAITIEGIKESGCFAVNILNSEQQQVSNQFAGGGSHEDRFASVSWREGVSGCPVLEESLATIECKAVQQVLAGTHWVVIGEVENIICRSGSPLLYFHSAYQGLGED